MPVSPLVVYYSPFIIHNSIPTHRVDRMDSLGGVTFPPTFGNFILPNPTKKDLRSPLHRLLFCTTLIAAGAIPFPTWFHFDVFLRLSSLPFLLLSISNRHAPTGEGCWSVFGSVTCTRIFRRAVPFRCFVPTLLLFLSVSNPTFLYPIPSPPYLLNPCFFTRLLTMPV
jgi:hypothetical protein